MSEVALTKKQQELYDLMSEISEEHWCAGWMYGLEFDLWERVKSDDPLPYGFREIDAALLKRLRELSEEIGGWIYTDETFNAHFVLLDEWDEIAEWSGAFKSYDLKLKHLHSLTRKQLLYGNWKTQAD